MQPITKEKAIAMFGSASALARALGVSPQAVYQRPEQKPIPDVHQLRLRYEILPQQVLQRSE
jgi:hypothetical protein